MIVGADLFDDEHGVMFAQQIMLANVDGAQPLRARAFEEFQIIRIIDYATGVRVFVIDPDRPDEICGHV